MKFLFIHQNFPGQFRHVARRLANEGHQVVGLGDARNLRGRPQLHPEIQVLAYQHERGGNPQTHFYIRDFEGQIRRGQQIARAGQSLLAKGFSPDVVVAHSGWGEALFLRDIFPHARLVHYCEYYYHGKDGDVGFDPEFPATLDDSLRVRVRNAAQLIGLVQMDQGLSPTRWQADRYPCEFRPRIEVIHEGIDTGFVKPDDQAVFEHEGLRLHAGEEIVTYVSRNLEPYRGFHVFMRMLPELLQARPRAQVLIVGGDEVSYGRRLPPGETYRQKYCAELGDGLDWSRVHFVGKLPYERYLKVLQVSSVHVYLTYPFVLSWSMLEAMSAGCLVLASNTAPVCEVIEHGKNGLLVDFHDREQWIRQMDEVLGHPEKYRHFGESARQTVVGNYDLNTLCLPRMAKFLKDG